MIQAAGSAFAAFGMGFGSLNQSRLPIVAQGYISNCYSIPKPVNLNISSAADNSG
jgi:hypothetical protein